MEINEDIKDKKWNEELLHVLSLKLKSYFSLRIYQDMIWNLDDECSICKGPKTNNASLIKCKACQLKVHSECFGLDKSKEDYFYNFWLCPRCEMICKTGKSPLIGKCNNCGIGKGALAGFMINNDFKFMHIHCADLSGDVYYFDVAKKIINRKQGSTISPIQNYSGKNNNCHYCHKSLGKIYKCQKASNSNCNSFFHLECLFIHGTLNKDLLHEKYYLHKDNIKFHLLCKDDYERANVNSYEQKKGNHNSENEHDLKLKNQIIITYEELEKRIELQGFENHEDKVKEFKDFLKQKCENDLIVINKIK